MPEYGVIGLANLVKLVAAEFISEGEAVHRAMAADWAWDGNQVLAAVEVISRMRREGRLREARIFSVLLMAVAEGVHPQLWRAVAVEFVLVVTEVAAERPDGDLYDRACDVAARLLPEADANELLAVAHLKLEPFAVDPITGTYPERTGILRARSGLRPFDGSVNTGMPPPDQSLAEAQQLFAALADMLTGVGRGVALVEQAYAAFSLSSDGGSQSPDAYLALCAKAWPLLESEPLGTARACWILARHNALGLVPGHPLVMPPPARLMEAYGSRLGTAVIAIGLQLFSAHDRALARSLCDQAVAALPDGEFEGRRSWFTAFPAHILPEDPTDCAAAAAGSLPTLAASGRAAGWTSAQVADAMLHALAHDMTGAQVDIGEVRPDRVLLRNKVVADRLERVGRNLVSVDDASAVVQLILAAGLHAESGFREAAERCLQFASFSTQESHDAACAAVDELVKWADLLAARLGQPGVNDLHQIYRTCFYHLSEEPRPLSLAALMQLTKGRAFARSQTEPGPLAPMTPVEAAALADAETAQARLPPQSATRSAEPDADLLDSELFLGAYLLDAEMQPGHTPLEELANRRRMCQRLDSIRLAAEIGPVPVLTDQEVRGKLPEDAVLVSIYEGGLLPDAEPGMLYAFETTAEYWAGIILYPDTPASLMPETSILTKEGGISRQIRLMPGTPNIAHVRRLLLEDPLNRPVSREAEGALAATTSIFKGMLGELARLRQAGKRQLVIWPHGGYYSFPFHLLPTGNGRILADDWTVAMVPSLQSVVGVPRKVGRESVLAVASPLGGVKYGLPGEPEVSRQAAAVAAEFGADPILDAMATTDRFISGATQARFIHIAAHGAQYLPAPLFDAIYLTDSPLYAHHVAQMDLRGVELVSLSACESALLRFDLNDNLYGMAAAFMRAGAAAVVGALWPVQATVAATFFVDLYSRLARGTAKLAAFRDAQSATRGRHPHYRDWAAFTIIGDCWERLPMESFEIPMPELSPVALEARQELHGRLEKSVLRTRRISVGEPHVIPLRPEDISDETTAKFLRREADAASFVFWLLSLSISFYPEPEDPINSAAIGLLLTHDGPYGSPPPIAWSIWPTKLSAPSSQNSTSLTVTAKLGLLEPQASHTITSTPDTPFLLGLGEGQSDPEWRFRRSRGREIEGIHRLAAIIRAPGDVQVTGAVTIAASIHRRIAGIVRYRASLPPGLSSISLPPHR